MTMNAVKKSWKRAYFFQNIMYAQHGTQPDDHGTQKQTANIIRSWLATNPRAITDIDAAMDSVTHEQSTIDTVVSDNQSLQEWCSRFNEYHKKVIRLKKKRLYEKRANKRRRSETETETRTTIIQQIETETDTEKTKSEKTNSRNSRNIHTGPDMKLLLSLKDLKKTYSNEQIIQACDILDNLLN